MDERRSAALIGREDERLLVEDFVRAPGPGLLAIEGEAGIGKTTLWLHGLGVAIEAGIRVLEVRCGAAERDVTYAGLAGLLPDRLLDAVLPTIPAARRAAIETALLRGGAADARDGPGADVGTVGLAILSILDALAPPDGILVAIDDVQWLDEPSARALGFACRRLGDRRVRVLVARRLEGAATPVAVQLEAAFAEGRLARVRVGPMSVGAIGRLAADRTGVVLSRPLAARVAEAAGGNPFLALEMVRALAERDRLPSPGEPFAVAGDVGSLLAGRIARLSPEADDLLLVVAMAARPTRLLLEAVLGPDAVAAALPEALRGEIVRIDGPHVRPGHPLVASVARAMATPARARRMNGALAEVVTDPEEAARHRALAADGPDPAVAAELDAASLLAHRRGAPAAAADLAGLAAARTPVDDPASMAARELAVARWRLDEGSVEEARGAAVRALGLLPAGPPRVAALVELAAIEQSGADRSAARAWIDRAFAEAGTDPTALVRVHATASFLSWGDVDEERAHADAALRVLAGHEEDEPEAASNALVVVADTDLQAGRGPRFDLIDRAVALAGDLDLPVMAHPETQRANYLGHAGRHDASIRAIESVVERAEREGDWASRPHLLRCLAWVELCAGRLASALGHADRAEEIAAEVGLDDGNVLAISGHVRAAVGREAEARDRCARAIRRAEEVANPWMEVRARAARGFLELTRGDADAAVAALTPAADDLERRGFVEPGWYRLHGDLGEALVLSGRIADAEASLERFESAATAGGHPWSLVASARVRGLVAAARGDVPGAVAAFERSLGVAGIDEMPIERARTLLALGSALRRANSRRAAREALDESRAILASVGCEPWAARAAREIAAISGRVATADDLTEMERRVALLAASGRTNREVAEELFISIRTVESHLSAGYRKLGVRSRTELSLALSPRSRGGDAPGDEGPPRAAG